MRVAEQAALAYGAAALSEQRFERDGRKREFSVTRVALPLADGSAPRHVLEIGRAHV